VVNGLARIGGSLADSQTSYAFVVNVLTANVFGESLH